MKPIIVIIFLTATFAGGEYAGIQVQKNIDNRAAAADGCGKYNQMTGAFERQAAKSNDSLVQAAIEASANAIPQLGGR